MSQLTRLHELNGKLDMLQDLKISGLGLSLEQQQKLLYTHQQVLDQQNCKQLNKRRILLI